MNEKERYYSTNNKQDGNSHDKFDRKYGKLREIKDEPARRYLLSLASFIEHNTSGEDRINKGAVCVLLAKRIIELERKGDTYGEI